jgi:putative membrane-bound dehydrogenase-like protein
MKRLVTCLRPGLILSLLAAPALSGAQFKFPGQTLSVPDGFEVELVAGPPLVDRPIAVDFDEEGHLYVSDSSGSNEKSDKQLQTKPHRILRLEDTDGDGRYDKRTVFADQMMFPEGVMWLEGSLYVGAPPSIWKLTDTDRDGVADKREEWHEGKTLTGCANDMHGPYRGPDGLIYWCKGAFAEQNYTLANGKALKSRAAHIFRKRPDGSGLEAVMTGGMDNPVDVVFTPGGERLFTTTFVHRPEAGKRDGLVHAVYGGLYGKVNDVLDDHKRTGDLMPVMVLWGPAAPCGLERYESQVFGPDYRDNVFACLFNLHKVTRHELAPDGATFRSKTTDFVTSDSPDFHPTDAVEDADGSLLVVDTGGWYKLCCPTSQLAKPDVLGAIYRIRRRGAAGPPDPRGRNLPWAKMGPSELAALLDDARVVVRRRAVAELTQHHESAVHALDARRKSGSPLARLNAVWALSRIDSARAREATRLALRDTDPNVRSAAAHTASLWRDPGAVPGLSLMLKNGTPAARRVAAEALGRIGNRSVVNLLLDTLAVSPPPDRFLEHSLTFALIELGDKEALTKALQAPAPATRRAALIALDQMDGGELKPEQVTAFLASSEPMLRQTAGWLVGRHPEWGEAVAGFFRDRLASPLAEAEREEVRNQLGQLARSPAIQELLAATVRPGALRTETTLLALRAMAQSGLKEMPASWTKELTRLLSGESAVLVRQAIATLRALPSPKSGAEDLVAELARVGRHQSWPEDLRLESLAAVPGGLKEVSPELFTFVRTNLARSRPIPIRAAAGAVVARARLTPEQLSDLTETVSQVGPLELPKLLSAFEKSHDEALGLKLVATLQEAKQSGVRPDQVRPLLTNFPATVQQQGIELLRQLDADADKQRAHLEEMMAQMKGGDIRRGQTIFNSAKAACSACHAIGYLGGHVGPDLTSIGQVRTERDLLESILYPSASFVRSYEPVVVTTKAGEEQSGVLRKDAADEVVLATGPETEVRVARSDIVEMRPGTVSVMPQGLDAQLSPGELADLLAFLKNTKWGAQ